MFRVCLVIVLSLAAGFSANDCKFDTKLEQYLLNEGFHRNITYSIKFENGFFFKNCIVGLNQVLPAGVFANPDELEDLRRVKKLSAIPRNRVNVELPSEESSPTSVFIFTKLIGDQARAWLPVHAKYHHSTAEGGFADNYIDAPTLYLRCPDRRLEKCDKKIPTMTFLCDENSKERCIWRIIPKTMLTDTLNLKVPVGNTSAYLLVSTVTACFIVTGSLYLLKTLHEYKIKNKNF